ncbi:VOC family protein [Phaeobacter italicus]|uniref:VOC family protein n=1 Tax=Phaeobacter italicus TaxID=481446 RepID=UPI0006191809|nr:VOC family protein [Phaeobacter italicus]MBY6042417.1 VOC family protein [Phaeobacter italicus]NKX40521.1 VOC family protein [Rhodobacteraceae bacterium R_SAG2]
MIFRYTILYVDDVPATLDFFERAFGLQRGFLHESGDYGELTTGDTKLAFSSTTLMKQLEKNPAAPNAKSPTFEIAFETENVKAALDRAIDAGATLVQDVRDEPWGQTTSYVSDPNGYLIEMCSAVTMPDAG